MIEKIVVRKLDIKIKNMNSTLINALNEDLNVINESGNIQNEDILINIYKVRLYKECFSLLNLSIIFTATGMFAGPKPNILHIIDVEINSII